jgi:hypothetical protein
VSWIVIVCVGGASCAATVIGATSVHATSTGMASNGVRKRWIVDIAISFINVCRVNGDSGRLAP